MDQGIWSLLTHSLNAHWRFLSIFTARYGRWRTRPAHYCGSAPSRGLCSSKSLKPRTADTAIRIEKIHGSLTTLDSSCGHNATGHAAKWWGKRIGNTRNAAVEVLKQVCDTRSIGCTVSRRSCARTSLEQLKCNFEGGEGDQCLRERGGRLAQNNKGRRSRSGAQWPPSLLELLFLFFS